MIIYYDSINVNAHVISGLLEEIEYTNNQRIELKQINFLVNNLRKDISSLYKKIGVTSPKEAMEKADNDKEIDKKIRDWMDKIFVPQTNFITNQVDEFNRKYGKNYDKLISKTES